MLENLVGELVIWTLSNELDSRVSACGCVEGGHQETVNKVVWIPRGDFNARSPVLTEHHLVTFGADGRIICWNLQLGHSKASALNLVKIFKITGRDQLSAAIEGQYALRLNPGVAENRDRPLGISSAEFSPHSPEGLILGTDSGGVLVAQFQVPDWSALQTDMECAHAYPSPVKYVLARYASPIHCVAWSPFHRNLVGIAGAFPGIHLFNILERTQICTIDTNEGQVFTLRFSSHEPCFLACGSERGVVTFFNLCDFNGGPEHEDYTGSRSIPVPTNRFELKKQKDRANPVFCMMFNDKTDSLLAVGDQAGSVSVYNTSTIRSPGLLSDKLLKLENFVNSVSS
ncbi:unnamed protein product [Mesocestoides corti]|uniref:Anaphase-promoting complex subunit 4 WD40 domain-containing protein n=1 Tax=Mesocestoides corti TaxID=53468 RepID=A0A0R3UGR3_MESCO|nr:unnamed protein product [Mesocestoides corti]